MPRPACLTGLLASLSCARIADTRVLARPRLRRRAQVAVVRVDYPQRWPDVFPALLATLPNGAVAVDLLLRILNTLNDEVVVNEEGNGYDSEVASRVKDGMRERCLPQLADVRSAVHLPVATCPP